MTDRFLSEDDLDLRDLSEEELYAWWNEWLRMAQATNDLDEHHYSHGVFDRDPHADTVPSPHPPGESETAG